MAAVDACLGGVRRTVPQGMTFERNFMTGSLGAGAVFTRASTGWYTNASGTLVSAATNTPRFDYDPVTLQLKGLLLEDAATNLVLQSGNLANPAWGTNGGIVAAPTVTGNQMAAPDGTVTAARVVYPAVSGAGASSIVFQAVTVAAGVNAFSVWLKGAVGGERVYLAISAGGSGTPGVAVLTTQWRRFVYYTAPALTAGPYYFVVGTDLVDTNQAATPAQTVFAWGGQIEATFMSSYIPTTTASVTRAADALSYPIASVTGFSTTQGSLAHEYIMEGSGANSTYSAPVHFGGASDATDWISTDRFIQASPAMLLWWSDIGVAGTVVGNCDYGPGVSIPVGIVQRGASSWALGNIVRGAHNGSAATANTGNVTSLPVIANLVIGGAMAFNNPSSQWARRVRYWPRQLSQIELNSVTS
jgi:hypothetical protein